MVRASQWHAHISSYDRINLHSLIPKSLRRFEKSHLGALCLLRFLALGFCADFAGIVVFYTRSHIQG